MKKIEEDAYCLNPNCEWTGNAIGMTSCPVCGSDVSNMDSYDDDTTAREEKYPSEFLARIKQDDDLIVE